MNPSPLVSVLMAVYNGEKYLEGAVRSVLDQGFRDFEFVIVDDCSSDSTAELLRTCGDSRIVYLRNERNLGQTASLNRALHHARGSLLARIDADDVFLPGKLSRQVEFMRDNPEVVVCGTWAYRIDLQGGRLATFAPPVSRLDIRFRLLRGVPVGHVSVMMRRDPIVAAGGYPLQYRFAADYALWSLLIQQGLAITNIPEPLMEFRADPATFGAAQKIGAAGDESAAIIRDNVRNIAGIELSPRECLDISLLFFPEAGLEVGATARAYLNLRRLAIAVYGSLPRRVRTELAGVLLWSYLKRWSSGGSFSSRWSEVFTILRSFTWRVEIVAVTIGAAVLAGFGQRPVAHLKKMLMLMWRRAGTSS